MFIGTLAILYGVKVTKQDNQVSMKSTSCLYFSLRVTTQLSFVNNYRIFGRLQDRERWLQGDNNRFVRQRENKYIYIYCYPQTDLSELFRVTRQARFPKLGSKPGQLKRHSKILPLSHEETSESLGNLNAYVSHLFLFTYICLTATENSIHMKSLALRLWQSFYFPR